MKIGILGSRGFIGRHLVKHLSKNHKVYESDKSLNLLKFGSFERFLKDKDIIIHAVGVNRGSEREVILGNALTTLNLVNALKKQKKAPKIIFLSSIRAGEESAYGASKLVAEMLLRDLSEERKTEVAILRLGNVFGEGGKPFYNSVVATFSYQIANGAAPSIDPKSKNKKLHLIYIGDLVCKIDNFLRKGRQRFILQSIVGRDEISIYSLAKVLQKLDNGKPPKSVFEKKLAQTLNSYE